MGLGGLPECDKAGAKKRIAPFHAIFRNDEE